MVNSKKISFTGKKKTIQFMQTNLLGKKVLFSHYSDKPKSISGEIVGVYLADELKKQCRTILIIRYLDFDKDNFVEIPIEQCKLNEKETD